MRILDRDSDDIKLIKQSPGTGKTSLVEQYDEIYKPKRRGVLKKRAN